MEAAKVHSLEDIHAAIAKRDERVVYTFTVPPQIAQETGVKTIGLVELTPQELLIAQARGGSDQRAMGFECVKESWRAINGKRITTGDGSADVEWAKSAPGWAKLRTLIAQAHASLHNPSDAEMGAFLLSRSATVG